MPQMNQRRTSIHSAQGPVFAAVKIEPTDLPRVLPPRDGVYLARRFRNALLGEAF